MEIYLDNSATTRPYREVSELVFETMSRSYGNPSSLHKMGVSAFSVLKTARGDISTALKCDSDEIIFTSDIFLNIIEIFINLEK
jgi:cysteine desulfurase